MGDALLGMALPRKKGTGVGGQAAPGTEATTPPAGDGGPLAGPLLLAAEAAPADVGSTGWLPAAFGGWAVGSCAKAQFAHKNRAPKMTTAPVMVLREGVFIFGQQLRQMTRWSYPIDRLGKKLPIVVSTRGLFYARPSELCRWPGNAALIALQNCRVTQRLRLVFDLRPAAHLSPQPTDEINWSFSWTTATALLIRVRF